MEKVQISERMPQSILLFFIDGIGLGMNTEDNPFVLAQTPTLRNLLGGQALVKDTVPYCNDAEQVYLVGLDASLGVEGLPQSATGQAALLTGQNISRVLGRHWPGRPTKTVQNRLLQFSIFKTLRQQGRRGYFANYFDSGYFEGAKKRRFPHSATTWSVLAARIDPCQGESALVEGKAVLYDLTGKAGLERGLKAPPISAKEAGRRLGRITQNHDFTLYEYFLTDHLGHQEDMKEKIAVLEEINQAVAGILETINPEKNLLIIVSDHGNLEDGNTKKHTMNLVPLLAIGVGGKTLTARATDLTDLAPFLRWWGKNKSG